MSAPAPGPMILAIGGGNDFLHVYQDGQDLLADHGIGTGAGELSGPLEFFDSEGYRLTGVFDPQWRLQSLARTTEPPNPALVRQRVHNCLDQVRSYLTSHPEKAAPYPLDQALGLIPGFDDPADFETCLKSLMSQVAGAGPIPRDFRPDPVHMWRHAAGWQHP